MPWEKQFDIEETLDKAIQLFWDQGYEATSMQNLVDAMGINRGSIYATYGGKRELFLMALRAYDDWIRKDALAKLEERLQPREAIRAMLNFFALSVPHGRPGRACLLTNTALELASHDEEIRDVVAESQRGVETFFLKMIKKGKQSGEIGAHVQPARAARGLLATAIGIVVLTRSRPEPALLQSIVTDAMARLD
ncbi:MAG: TetR family transcriptional regulator [Rhodospirillales bacterium CG15_BIG_FIL_POST_REV_8_21_14_020_66_15]|nr:MAG: TetR family transcriptional regulator [Rhodospirillales bacterium CG15_BIG_FIL_POST_REV_8_21_14_020_66_15]